MELEEIFIDQSKTILQAIEVINKGIYQIALVINKDKQLIGTITDGDIRRSILKNISLKCSVKKIMNQNFKFCSIKDNPTSILQEMKRHRIQQMPLLNEKGVVLDIYINKDNYHPHALENTVVIMAGGKGKRLRPYTENCPKPMININNKPILEILLEQYINCGFRNFYFSVNYLKEQIKDYFGNGDKWDISINYLEENSELGTAGSLKLLPKNIIKPIIVSNGDVLTKTNYRALIKSHEKYAFKTTICVRDYEVNIPFGVINSEENLFKGISEKPTFNFKLNAGIYVINPELIGLLDKEEFLDMPDFLNKIKNNGNKINLYPIHEYWLDIGREETLKQAWEDWMN
tara:strand:+ start:32691 stop:33728 length:1038 start_codon:yes stop_codon:yes gene_type:complete